MQRLSTSSSGAVQIIKVPSTPADPSSGFMAAVERGLQRCDVGGEAVRLVVHATTVATNALIEGKTASLGMLTTQGFRDILEIGRQIRARLYDVHLTKPRPLVPRRWSFGIRERLDAEGQVLEPLDVEAVRQAVRQCKAAGIEAMVCCFLHSYINPEHERLAAAIVREEYPEAFLSVSSEVCPEFREYLRASTTAVNAAIMPLVSRYLDALESQLQARRITAPFYVMQSSGGVMSVQSAKHKPVYMIESGPAAGVIAAGAFAAPHGYANVISFDMGGTTAKVGLIQDGQLKLSTEFEVGGQAITPLGEGRGSGYPVRTPVIDLIEVGAGGGSEAWIDAGGALRVGPRSAGAVPGPACYGQGGTTPTITDANLLLGRLNPAFFLGGEITLDPDASREAIVRQCAEPLGLDPLQAAHGIVEIANAHMIGAMRLDFRAAWLRSAHLRPRGFRWGRSAARQRLGARPRYPYGVNPAESWHCLSARHAHDGHQTRICHYPSAGIISVATTHARYAVCRFCRAGRSVIGARGGRRRAASPAAQRRSALPGAVA